MKSAKYCPVKTVVTVTKYNEEKLCDYLKLYKESNLAHLTNIKTLTIIADVDSFNRAVHFVSAFLSINKNLEKLEVKGLWGYL
jgi:hypothetical protein